MKILFIATVTVHIKAFHTPYMKWLKEQGWEVHVATYGSEDTPHCDKKHNISVRRSPFRLNNIRAYFELNAILKNETFDIVHGHTPMGGILTRLCGRRYGKNGTRIIYTAHGFHFYKGAPLLNWLLYYPIEKWLSGYTDTLITINKEDYAFAKRKMKAKNIYYIPGIGVDTGKFANPTTSRESKRDELGIPPDADVLLSVGELNKNKNHRIAIEAISKINKDNVYYIICGQGKLDEALRSLCKSLNNKRVLFLGYRTDITDLLHMSDIFVFPSLREGLSVSLMEAMAAGLPCIVSNIRGNSDLIEHGKGGFLCNVNNVDQYSSAIEKILERRDLGRDMGEYNQMAVQGFDIAVVLGRMKEIYV